MRCKYFGKPSGLFKKVHKDCQMARGKAATNIINKVSQTVITSGDLSLLEKEIHDSALSGYLTEKELDIYRNIGFDHAIDILLEDGVITDQEESKINAYLKYFKIDITASLRSMSHEKIIKGAILNEILQGKIPRNRLNIEGNLPFFLEKNEAIIWIFQNVEFYEQRTRTAYQGRSQGVSIKIAKGLYYRMGQFKGNPVITTEMTFIANGLLALTNTNLYFASSNKNFKTPYAKLIYMTQYSDGIELQKDGATAKPQTFKELDGWFAYNVISNLRNI